MEQFIHSLFWGKKSVAPAHKTVYPYSRQITKRTWTKQIRPVIYLNIFRLACACVWYVCVRVLVCVCARVRVGVSFFKLSSEFNTFKTQRFHQTKLFILTSTKLFLFYKMFKISSFEKNSTFSCFLQECFMISYSVISSGFASVVHYQS
jgi:hypothetical protein